MKSAQNQFPAITQAERMVDPTWKPVEEIIGMTEECECTEKNVLSHYHVGSGAPGAPQSSIAGRLLSTFRIDVATTPPAAENWLQKHIQHEDMSTEDKHDTNHINKCNDMNMNTRKMHIT